MNSRSNNLQRRLDSLRLRIEALSSLRTLVCLPSAFDITKRQWSLIESELKVIETRLLRRLEEGTRVHLQQIHNRKQARLLNNLLGEIELEMSKVYTFFDTYMDVLTQRHTPELGRLLAGCDVLAWDGIHKDHPALESVEPPLVYCDRGFGASTIRQSVTLLGHTYNVLPLVEIPYSRLNEKCNLTSILHEIGHEAMTRLGLVKGIAEVFRSILSKAGAPSAIRDLYEVWSFEIGPDFWGFCACGIAATGTIKEILALPPQQVFRVNWSDPHPPPFIRSLISFECCRQVWGSNGLYDDWELEWLDFYPLEDAPMETHEIITAARKHVPLICRTLLRTKFRALNGKTLPDLFDLDSLIPYRLQRIARTADSGRLDLKGLSVSAQLAVFRMVKERANINEKVLDSLMTLWLLKLAKQKKI